MRIRELPLDARPASRIADHGPAALSDAELLALVSGQHDLEICERSLREYQGWVGLLRADIRAVAASIGTPRRAASLKAALEIGRRLLVAGYEGRYQVRSPADVAQLFMVEMMALDQEELWVAALDTKKATPRPRPRTSWSPARSSRPASSSTVRFSTTSSSPETGMSACVREVWAFLPSIGAIPPVWRNGWRNES